jgi:hypothetical protein
MSTLPQIFKLEVQQVEQTCWFKLTWGQGQQLSASLKYPVGLTNLYQEWHRVYRNFYKQLPISRIENSEPASQDAMRGRVNQSAGLQMPPADWQIKLVQVEANLLHEFHRWLRSAELFEIRKTIAQASQRLAEAELAEAEVFLTCDPLALARLPWEVWEIGMEFTTIGSARIVRMPVNIHDEPVEELPPPRRQRRNQTRILAILGDETGLDFKADREAVRSLTRIAEVQFIGWQPGQTDTEVKHRIRAAIADEQGWDVLFFAGHSNEAVGIGGELAVTPNAALSIREIEHQLTIARRRGLQFALFNSCNGLDIAASLIDLGFSQVVVMREPIHNRVAQAFLVEFLQTLAKHNDVQDSMLAACQMLKLEKNLTYPSAYLVPSLFCHPGASLFRIPHPKPLWKQLLRQLMPKRWEAIALAAACLLFSPLLPLQDYLLDQRVGVQAVWRDVTNQVPPMAPPPVLLVQVDSASIMRHPSLARPDPINQGYLADLLDNLTQQNANVIGIDYLLDRVDPNSTANTNRLRQALQATTQKEAAVVFGTLFNEFDEPGIFTPEAAGIAERNWTMQGYVSLLPHYVTLPYSDEDCTQTCPFSYLLSLIQAAKRAEIAIPSSPSEIVKTSNNQSDLRSQWVRAIEQASPQYQPLDFLQRSRLTPAATWFYETFGLPWLKPIVDYSIPPDRIYERLSAWRLQEDAHLTLKQLPQQVVLIGAGEYTDSGSKVADELDLYPVPAAVKYWRDRLPSDNSASRFPNGTSENALPYLPQLTGVEVHAYMVHHLLHQWLVVPIPDLWVMGLAVFLGRSLALRLQQQPQRLRQWLYLGLIIATIFYGLIGLQFYLTVGVLLPWLLPTGVVWIYVLLTFRRKINA